MSFEDFLEDWNKQGEVYSLHCFSEEEEYNYLSILDGEDENEGGIHFPPEEDNDPFDLSLLKVCYSDRTAMYYPNKDEWVITSDSTLNPQTCEVSVRVREFEAPTQERNLENSRRKEAGSDRPKVIDFFKKEKKKKERSNLREAIYRLEKYFPRQKFYEKNVETIKNTILCSDGGIPFPRSTQSQVPYEIDTLLQQYGQPPKQLSKVAQLVPVQQKDWKLGFFPSFRGKEYNLFVMCSRRHYDDGG